MNKNLEDGLILYAIDLIKKEVSPSEYYKDDLIKEIKTHGIDSYGYLEENGEWKLIDELEQRMNEVIRNWCELYEKEFDKETILKMPLDKLFNSSRHTYLTIVPDDFPKCNDYKAEHFLRLLKMNVEDFIKLDFKEIHELPLCSPKLKEEKKEDRYLKVLEYQASIIDYINNLGDDDCES